MNSTQQQSQINQTLGFILDGSYLIPTLNGEPLEQGGVDLAPAVTAVGYSFSLYLDTSTNSLILSGPSSDSVIDNFGSILPLDDLDNVQIKNVSDGDILCYQGGKWQNYSIPSAADYSDVVSILGLNSAGMMVKTNPSNLGGNTASTSGIPVGGGLDFYGVSTSIPTGFMIADGSPISRSTYSGLFGIMGIDFGAGDGSTTFNIPDRRGVVSVGVDTRSGSNWPLLGSKVGEYSHTLGANEMPSHGHGVGDPGHSHGFTRDVVVTSGSGSNRTVLSGSGQQLAWNGAAGLTTSGTGIWIGATGGSQAHNNIQPTIANYKLIRVI